MHNFKVGDKVRVKAGIGTYKGWVGVEGVVEDVNSWMVYVRLTTPATGDENPQPVDYIAQLQCSGIELIEEPVKEAVNHPAHYGGDTTYEVIKVAEAWGLDKDAYLFNVLKYIARAGKKGSKQEDLKKADFYIKRRIDNPLD